MTKKLNIFLLMILFFTHSIPVYSNENFLEEAKKKFNEKKLEDSKFLFQRNIVFNPKNAESYLYLAKIYNSQKNLIEEEKNLKTTLLLDTDNEEAMYLLIEIELKKFNYSKVKEFNSPRFNKFNKKLFSYSKLKTMSNDLEIIAFKIYPKLKTLKVFLEKLPNIKLVRMTGSGSAMIAYFSSSKLCKQAEKKVKTHFKKYWCKRAKTM